MRHHSNTRIRCSNDERRLRGIARVAEEARIVRWDDECDDKDGDDVENENTPEDALGCERDIPTWVLRLSGGVGDTFDSTIGIGSVGEGRPETKEPAEGALDTEVLNEGTLSEANVIIDSRKGTCGNRTGFLQYWNPYL